MKFPNHSILFLYLAVAVVVTPWGAQARILESGVGGHREVVSVEFEQFLINGKDVLHSHKDRWLHCTDAERARITVRFSVEPGTSQDYKVTVEEWDADGPETTIASQVVEKVRPTSLDKVFARATLEVWCGPTCRYKDCRIQGTNELCADYDGPDLKYELIACVEPLEGGSKLCMADADHLNLQCRRCPPGELPGEQRKR